jgi:hypothetical protein
LNFSHPASNLGENGYRRKNISVSETDCKLNVVCLYYARIKRLLLLVMS